MKYIFYSFLFTLFITGCGELKPLSEKKDKVVFQGFNLGINDYLVDGKGGLFINHKWYSYDAGSHLIWPYFDIYIIKSKNQYYKLQILDYYKDNNILLMGHYKLRIQTRGVTKEIQIDASACGNPHTNPKYESCIKNPNENAYTYLNLDTLNVQKFSDEIGNKDFNWHIAFKTTDIKLNSGLSGPSDTVAAMAFQDAKIFTSNGQVDFKYLKSLANSNYNLEKFNNINLNGQYRFYLPRGIDEIVYKNYWYKENNIGLRESISTNWWMLKSSNENNHGIKYSKFQFALINEEIIDNNFHTTMKLKYFYQFENEVNYESKIEEINLPIIDSSIKYQTFCIKFNPFAQSQYDCKINLKDYDLKLFVLNQNKDGNLNRTWKVKVMNGAIGPIEEKHINQIKTGKVK